MLTRQDAIAALTTEGAPYELATRVMNGRTCRVFTQAPPTLRDLYAAARSDKEFLVYGDERLTFEETWRRACTLATALVEDYGVRKGDRVAISMRNYPEWVIAYMAATAIGGIATAMNALWQSDEMDHALQECAPAVFFADQERIDRLEACSRLSRSIPVVAVRAIKPLKPGMRHFGEVMSRREVREMPAREIAPTDLAIIYFTSGTTGHAKGACSTHSNVISALLSWEVDTQAAVMTGVFPTPPADAPQPVALIGIPLFHVTGSHAIFLQCFRAQRRLVSMYKWDVEQAIAIIEREGVTNFTAPSAVTGDLIEAARRQGKTLDTLTYVGGGGASRAPEQVRAIARVFANARPGTGWGMTETNAIGASIAASDYLDHPESSGRASCVLDFRIVGEDGRVLPVGERGELQVRGASVIQGYWNRPEASAATFDGEWLKTGDVAQLDAEGFVYIVDRIKDMVIRGGENIGCGAVEAALLEHPAVREAAVYGVPDPRLGEELAATVYACEPVPEDELRTFLAARLARFQVPRFIAFSREPLPRIASGKILKRELRSEAIARLALSHARQDG